MIKPIGIMLVQLLMVVHASDIDSEITLSSSTAAAIGVSVSNVHHSALFIHPSASCVYDFDLKYEPKLNVLLEGASIQATVSLWSVSEETLLFSEAIADAAAFSRRLRIADSSDLRLIFLLRTDSVDYMVDLGAIVQSLAVTADEDTNTCNEPSGEDRG